MTQEVSFKVFEPPKEADEIPISKIPLQQLKKIYKAPENIPQDPEEALPPRQTDEASTSTRTLYEYHKSLEFDDAYKVTRGNRGRCLIVSNRKFANKSLHPERTGTDIDRDKLKKLFQEDLGYQVEVRNNLTADEIQSECSMFLNQDMENCDSCVLCILSHGNKDCIIGSDSKTIKESEIFSLLKDNRNLTGKPVLVIIQACQTTIKKALFPHFCFGENKPDVGAEGPAAEETEAIIQLLQQTNKLDEANIKKAAPDSHDVIIAYSTMPGQLSYRNEFNGSWFIQALVLVFDRQFEREHVADMLVTVKRIVLKAFSNLQAPHTVNRLRKKFYFFN